jgi:protein phosphatase
MTAPQQIPATLSWTAMTRPGRRKPGNDDSWLVFASSATGAQTLPAESSHSLQRHDLVFAVSDGMGGGNAGDVASRSLLERMSQIIPETFRAAALGIYPDYLEHLDSAIREVHRHVNEAAAQNPAHKGMAATLALAWFTPENLYLANVGDSRLYRMRAGRLEQLSEDHSFAWRQWKRGQLSEVQYRTHARRSALFEIIGGGHTDLNPYLAAHPYAPGDVFLLCTDGLIDGIWERQLADILGSGPPETTAPALLDRAFDNAGLDDTTLIVIAVSRPDENQPPEST